MIYLLFATNLVVTLLVEGLLIFLWYKKGNFVYYSLLGNLLTNPAMNLLLLVAVHTFGAAHYGTSLVFLEIAVVIVEAFLYRMLGNVKMSKALLLSLVLNLASFLSGLGVGRLFTR